MASSSLVRSEKDGSNYRLVPDLQAASALQKELEDEMKTTAQSEIMLLRQLLGNGVVDVTSFRERTQGSWEMIGVVSALFLTMDRYTEQLNCEDEDLAAIVPFCDQLHPLCAGTATLFAACAVVSSMILYIEMTFVPDEFLGDWMGNLSWSVELPLICFILSISAWAVDLMWQGVVHHGTFGKIFVVMMLVPAMIILALYLRAKSLTNKYLMMAASKSPPAPSAPEPSVT